MRCRRFTVLSFAVLLAGLLAASLASESISAVVVTWIVPVDSGLTEPGAAPSTADGDAVVGDDAIPKNGWRLCGAGGLHVLAMPCVLLRTDCDALGTHSGRAPPLA